LPIPGSFGPEFGVPKLVPLLNSAGYRTIVVEPLGIGSSGRPQRADYSLTAQAERIAGVLDSLAIRQAFVIAHSLGGAEAFRLAYRRPDLVRGLISLEGGPTEAAITPAFKRALRFAPWIKLFGGIKLVRKKIRTMLLASSGDSTWVTDDVVIGYTAGAAQSLDATLKAYLAMANSREPEKLWPHLAEIRCPVRLVLLAADYYPQLGGVPEPVHNLALQLNSWGHAATVISSHMGSYPDAAFVRRVGTSRVIYSNGGVSRITTGWGLRRQLEAVFGERRYDIVHVHGGLAPTFGLAAPIAAWRVGIPVVATFHSWFARSLACRVFRRPLQRILDRHAATIAVS